MRWWKDTALRLSQQACDSWRTIWPVGVSGLGGAVLDNDESHPVLPDGAGSASETERHTDRNQWLKAPQYETTDSNLADLGRVVSRTLTALAVRGTPGLGDVAGREATVKACGVTVAMMLGHNWVPIPSKDSRVYVGTIPVPPEDRRIQQRDARLSAWPADRAGVGRRTRSSPRPGEPAAWRRGPV